MKTIINEEPLANDRRLLRAIHKISGKLSLSQDKAIGFIPDERFKIRTSLPATHILEYEAGALSGKPLADLLCEEVPGIYSIKAWTMAMRHIKAGKAHCFTRLAFNTGQANIFRSRCIVTRLTDMNIMLIAVASVVRLRDKQEAIRMERAFAKLKTETKKNPNPLSL